MGRRNRRQRANERRRKMRTYESEPELGSDEQSELSRETSYPSLDTHIYEAQDMHNQVEIKIESPISNSNANAQHLIDRRNANTLYIAALRGDWKAAEAALRLDKNELNLLYSPSRIIQGIVPSQSGEPKCEGPPLCEKAVQCAVKHTVQQASFDKNMASIKITERGDRVLHIAAAAKQTAFVRNLVEYLNASDLELKNAHGNTAFCIAAVSGVVEIAKVMYKKNKKLPVIRSMMGKTPLEMAILLGNREMVEYLYTITPLEDLRAKENMENFVALIDSDMYDIALNILNYSRIDISARYIEKALQALARKPLRVHGFRRHWRWERLVKTIAYISRFGRIYSTQQMMSQAGPLVKVLWERVMTLPDSDILELIRESQIFHDAAKLGNVEFLTLLTHSYPDLFWKINKKYHSIFHVALINRQEKVFGLIYQIGAVKDLIMFYRDDEGNNILHMAGKLAPSSRLKIVSGAALQMQRELRWFKEVEKMVPSSFLRMKNKYGLTPKELFSKEHSALVEDGEMWMKNTVSFCLVVATLIATVALAAAITVPGGNNQESGTPILLKDGWFKVFVISNAVAMFSSTTSIMIYLSILTSRYVEDDFLFSLPAKLMFGLISILVSIVCMVLTFSATFFSVYDEENQGPLRVLVAGLAWLPIIIYPMLNYKFWNTIVYSTGWLAVLTFQPDRHKLYK